MKCKICNREIEDIDDAYSGDLRIVNEKLLARNKWKFRILVPWVCPTCAMIRKLQGKRTEKYRNLVQEK